MGFSLACKSDPHTLPVTNTTTTNLKNIVFQKLHNEIKLGRIAGPFVSQPFSAVQISPLSLHEKKVKGNYRLLHNLSFPYDNTSINSNIPEEAKTVRYSSIRNAIHTLLHLPTHARTAKTDIEDAYRLIPVTSKIRNVF